MKSIDQLGISPWPWKIIPSPDKPPGRTGIDGIRAANDSSIVETDGGFYPPEPRDAVLFVEAPNLYDRLFRLVTEIDRILDHTAEGHATIDCECSHLECAAAEAREILDRISEQKQPQKEEKGN